MIEVYRNIGNHQSVKRGKQMKRNCPKSRIIFFQENEHLVYIGLVQMGYELKCDLKSILALI